MKVKILFIAIILSLITHYAEAMGKPINPGNGGDSSSSSSQSSSSSSSSVSSSSSSSSSASSSASIVEQIKAIAGTSKCAAYSWNDRGSAPKGYIKGVALAYARSVCRLDDPRTDVRSPASLMSQAQSGLTSKDALAWYKPTFDKLNLETSRSGTDTLRSLYTLGMGLGLRESSGNYCEGFDASAGPETASEAEAGAWQTSYNSISTSPELKKLYDEYRKDPSKCFLDVFKEGAAGCRQGYVGSGAGLEFQKFSRACPTFAAEYTMTLLRVLRNHYGPINRKEAEVNYSCNTMLDQVEVLVEKGGAQACNSIN